MAAPATCSSFLCFIFFSAYALFFARAFQILGDSGIGTEDQLSQWETKTILCYLVAAVIWASSICYISYKCTENQTSLLIIRLIGNFCAMLIFLGMACNVLTRGGVETENVKSYSTANVEEWGATVAFGFAWLFLSTFELNELSSTLLGRYWTKVILKIQVFLFWFLVAVSACLSGAFLKVKDVDEDIAPKLLLATGGMSALTAIVFLVYSTCERKGFLSAHMVLGTLTAVLFIVAKYFEFDQYKTEMKIWKLLPGYDSRMEANLFIFIGNVSMGLALLAAVGFDFYFYLDADFQSGKAVTNIQIVNK